VVGGLCVGREMVWGSMQVREMGVRCEMPPDIV